MKRVRVTHAVRLPCSAAEAFCPIQRIGGVRGWYFADGLWRLRGWLDRLLGGPGLGRGRSDPVSLRTGEALDCWRVEAFEPDRRLRLAAEMRMPGRGWLEFEVEPDGAHSLVRQTATFEPHGPWGYLYWYALDPVHRVVFAGLIHEIARRAKARG